MKIIISENQVDKIKSKIHEYVKKYGIEKCKQIFGDKVLFTIGFNNDPMEYLNLFNDLKQVHSVEYNFIILFRYEKGRNQMIYDKSVDVLSVNDNEIWSVIDDSFDLGITETKKLILRWFDDNYGFKPSTTTWIGNYHSPRSMSII